MTAWTLLWPAFGLVAWVMLGMRYDGWSDPWFFLLAISCMVAGPFSFLGLLGRQPE